MTSDTSYKSKGPQGHPNFIKIVTLDQLPTHSGVSTDSLSFGNPLESLSELSQVLYL